MACRPYSSRGDEDLCVADLTVRGEWAQRCRPRSRSSDAATRQDWRGSAQRVLHRAQRVGQVDLLGMAIVAAVNDLLSGAGQHQVQGQDLGLKILENAQGRLATPVL